jgi:hypothetical protein
MVGDPHNSALRDVVVPYANIIMFFSGIGRREEAQSEGAIVRHKSVAWCKRLVRDKVVAGCTQKY